MNIQPEILTWVIGSIIGASLLVYCGYALFGDRSHGRRRCPKCGHEFEAYQPITEDALTKCPQKGCRGKVQRLIGGGGGLLFKGSGFYITDYRSDNYKKAAKADSSSSSSGGDSSGGESKSSSSDSSSSSSDKSSASSSSKSD